MPTGSGKTPLYSFLSNIIQRVRSQLKVGSLEPSWSLDHASFEKMGELISMEAQKDTPKYAPKTLSEESETSLREFGSK